MNRIRKIVIVLLFISSMFSFGEEKGLEYENLWYHVDELVGRLYQEKWTYNVVLNELKEVKWATNDVKELIEYPSSVHKLFRDERAMIEIRIQEVLEKVDHTRSLVHEIENPILGALLITQEMLQDEANKDMVSILVEDNRKRVQKLIQVRKYSNALWGELSEILKIYEKHQGIKAEEAVDNLFGDDFLKVLVSQIGGTSDLFYKRMFYYKDISFNNASNKDRVKIKSNELLSIRHKIEAASGKRVKQDVETLIRRVENKYPVDELYHYYGIAFMREKEYGKAIKSFKHIGEKSLFYTKSQFYIIEVLFEMEKDEAVLELYHKWVEASRTSPLYFQKVQYLAIQSLYSLKKDEEVEQLLLSFKNKNIFYYKSLLIYAKSLVRRNKPKEASNIFKLIVKQKSIPDKLRTQAQLTLAMLKVEQKYYDNALLDFNSLLDKEDLQAPALYGIVWCYIKMGNVLLAEKTLNSLINQYPDSPSAIEGVLLLSKWKYRRAIELWKYKKNKIKSWVSFIVHETNTQKNKRAPLTINENQIEKRARNQNEMALLNINKLFEESIELVDYVKKHYKSGEFLEVEFLKKRESSLRRLNEILEGKRVKDKGHISKKSLDRKMYKSQSLKLDMLIGYQKWINELEKEYSQILVSLSQHGLLRRKKEDVNEEFEKIKFSLLEKKEYAIEDALSLIERLQGDIRSSFETDKLLFYKGYLMYKRESERGSFEMVKGVKQVHFGNTTFEYHWNQLIENYPQSKYIEVTKYLLGQALVSQNDSKGFLLLKRFVKDYPKSKWFESATYLLGDYYFFHEKYKLARNEFYQILKRPESKHFKNSLYKQAWVFYRAGAFKKSLRSFSYLLEEEINEKKLYQNKKLITEVIEMVSLCFTELNYNSKKVVLVLNAIYGKPQAKELIPRVLHKIAVVYRKRGDLESSIKLFQFLVTQFPYYPILPQIYADFALVYDINGDFEKAVKMRKLIFEKFNDKTKWYSRLENNEDKRDVDVVCEDALGRMAQYYFTEAKIKRESGNGDERKKSLQRFEMAISIYTKILKVYPNSLQKSKWHYELGESYFILEDYFSAAKNYFLSADASEGARGKMAAYNAVISSKKHLEKLSEK